MDSHRLDCRCHFVSYDIKIMDAFILFVMPPLLGLGIYYIMKNEFVQFMIEYIKEKVKEKNEKKS